MNARNPQRNLHGTIDLEIDHPVYGWIPFTASPNDPDGAAIYALAEAGEYGPVASYVAPPPPPPVVPQSVTRFQALAALHLAGHLPAVQAIMADPETPVIAKLAWDNALSFERSSPTLASLAQAIGLTSQDLDDLFTMAASIEA